MSQLFFTFESFDREIEKKLASLECGTGPLFVAFADLLDSLALPQADRRLARDLCARLPQLPFDKMYPDYLTHPIRVSGSYLLRLKAPSYDDVALSLCHNIIEAGLLDELEARYLAPGVKGLIATLTIDRAKERDPAYLRGYYDGICSARHDLIVLKALDKLDNTLWWVEFDVEDHDVHVVRDEVCPRVSRVDSQLGAYLRDLTGYVLTEPAKLRQARKARAT